MIRTDIEFHSTKRLVTELKAEVAEIRKLLDQSYSRDVELAITQREQQIHNALEEIAEYEACIHTKDPPAVITVMSESPLAASYERGLFWSRLARGIPQKEMAERLTCTQGLVSRWEGASPLKEQMTKQATDSSRTDIQLSTICRWGNALGYSFSGYFVDRNLPSLSARAILPLAMDLTATLAQFAGSTDEAVRSAMKSVKVFSDADCITCYVPDVRSNALRLAFFDGVEHKNAMEGLVWDENVPLALLGNRDRTYGEYVSNVQTCRDFKDSLFIVREKIESSVYVVFDTMDGKGILFMNYRKRRSFDDSGIVDVIRLLSYVLSLFFSSVTQNSKTAISRVPMANSNQKKKRNLAASIFVAELERYTKKDTERSLWDEDLWQTYLLDGKGKVRDVLTSFSKLPVPKQWQHACTVVRDFRNRQNQRTLVVYMEETPNCVAHAIRAADTNIRAVFASPVLGAHNAFDGMLIGFQRSDAAGEPVAATAYRAMLRAYCSSTAANLLFHMRQFPVNRKTKKCEDISRIIVGALSELDGDDPADRARSACSIVSRLYGAVATDLWTLDASGKIADQPFAYWFEKSWKKKRLGSSIIEALYPRDRGLTSRLLTEQQPHPVLISDASKDSQVGEGTRKLRIGSILGIPILGPTSWRAEAVLWIRFSDDVSNFFGEQGSGVVRKRNADLQTIANFFHLLTFSDRYEQLIDFVQTESSSDIINKYSIVNSQLFLRDAFVMHESDEKEFRT